ncbi:MAG: hypothetical protein HC908_02770 [Calothrix sp. SM1_7_51]|nr:hypothetical protein [Calothrix sp. SM1_7_51]
MIDITANSILFDNDVSGVNSGLGSVTRGRGNGGTIIINAGNAVFRNRGGISLNTDGEGKAGRLSLTTNSLTIENSGIFSEDGGTGTAGEINIAVNGEMILREGRISVSAKNNSNPNSQLRAAGNISLSAATLSLEPGFIVAETESGNGGDINLSLQKLLSLNFGSLISTTAGTTQAGGNGGNINLKTQFIVADPNQNSDITANAFAGSGR